MKRFDLPDAQRFAVCFCSNCGTRVPHKIRTTENMLIPAGLLDGEIEARPENSIFWDSKASWYVAPDALPKFSEYRVTRRSGCQNAPRLTFWRWDVTRGRG